MTLRFHLIPVKRADMTKTSDTSCLQICGTRRTLYCWWEGKRVQLLWKSDWKFLQKTGMLYSNREKLEAI